LPGGQRTVFGAFGGAADLGWWRKPLRGLTWSHRRLLGLFIIECMNELKNDGLNEEMTVLRYSSVQAEDDDDEDEEEEKKEKKTIKTRPHTSFKHFFLFKCQH
jgi:hypothetical protein